MKNYKGKFKSYSIDELSQEAKQRAYDNWYVHSEYPWASEVRSTLGEFCRLFDVNCYDWNYDSYNHNYRFEINNDEISELKGIRLATYIWNNYAKYIQKGRYYSLWSETEKADNPYGKKLKSRHSKVLISMTDCPLTGVCFDNDILDSIIECLTYKRMFDSYEELIDDCLDRFFSHCCKDVEWCNSMEYFEEQAEANEYEFDEDGNDFHLPVGFKESA